MPLIDLYDTSSDYLDTKSDKVSLDVINNSKNKGVICRIGGPGANYTHETRNGRKYVKRLWENIKNSEMFQEGLEHRMIIGELDHPEERLDYSLKEGAIVLTKMNISDDGNVYTEFDVLNTLPGRLIKTYYDAGCKIGVSSRGLGEEIVENGETIIDPDTYQFYCFDAVAFPAVKEARMELLENVSPKAQKMNTSIKKEINDCTDIQQLNFIESISKKVDLYSVYIKEAIDFKKQQLNKLEENKNKTDDINNNDLIKLCEYIRTYLKQHEDEKTFECNFNEEKNKIEISISDSDNDSDEDTQKNNDEQDTDNTIILNELNEQSNQQAKHIDELEKEIKQKELVIQSLLSKQHTSDNELSKSKKVNKNLISKQTTSNNSMNELEKISNNLKLENKQLTRNNNRLKSNNERLNERLIRYKSMYEKLHKANNEFSKMFEAYQATYDSLENKYSSLKEQYESIKKMNQTKITENSKIKQQVDRLQESVQISKSSKQKLIENNNQLKAKNSDLLSQVSSIKKTNKKLIEDCHKSLDGYIYMICNRYNLSESILRRQLGKEYTINDVDNVAKQLAENTANIQSLPFEVKYTPKNQIYTENIGLTSSPEYNKQVQENLDSFEIMIRDNN